MSLIPIVAILFDLFVNCIAIGQIVPFCYLFHLLFKTMWFICMYPLLVAILFLVFFNYITHIGPHCSCVSVFLCLCVLVSLCCCVSAFLCLLIDMLLIDTSVISCQQSLHGNTLCPQLCCVSSLSMLHTLCLMDCQNTTSYLVLLDPTHRHTPSKHHKLSSAPSTHTQTYTRKTPQTI